jgi:hypothetical protein
MSRLMDETTRLLEQARQAAYEWTIARPVRSEVRHVEAWRGPDWADAVPSREGWQAFCSVCGLLKDGYAYAEAGRARGTLTRHVRRQHGAYNPEDVDQARLAAAGPAIEAYVKLDALLADGAALPAPWAARAVALPTADELAEQARPGLTEDLAAANRAAIEAAGEDERGES